MKIRKLIVHHSASNSVTTKKVDIEMWHKQRGFSQIGYRKIIEGKGNIVDGRPETTQGAHTRGANQASLGVCVIGDFERNVPSSRQIAALISVLTDWCKKYKIDTTNIYGHYNTPGGNTKTSCPGKNIINRLPIVKQKVAFNLK